MLSLARFGDKDALVGLQLSDETGAAVQTTLLGTESHVKRLAFDGGRLVSDADANLIAHLKIVSVLQIVLVETQQIECFGRAFNSNNFVSVAVLINFFDASFVQEPSQWTSRPFAESNLDRLLSAN